MPRVTTTAGYVHLGKSGNNVLSGSFSSGGKTCYKCPNGYYTNKVAQTSCLACPAGTYSYVNYTANANAAGPVSCTDCAQGTYSVGTNNTKCAECVQNYFQNATGTTFCYKCPAGKRTDHDKQDHCMDFPTSAPTGTPTNPPTSSPTISPTARPTDKPTDQPVPVDQPHQHPHAAAYRSPPLRSTMSPTTLSLHQEYYDDGQLDQPAPGGYDNNDDTYAEHAFEEDFSQSPSMAAGGYRGGPGPGPRRDLAARPCVPWSDAGRSGKHYAPPQRRPQPSQIGRACCSSWLCHFRRQWWQTHV